MRWIRDLEESCGLVIRAGWLANDVSLTIGHKRSVLTYGHKLEEDEPLLRLGLYMMIGVLRLKWDGTRFRFRFPLPDDSAEMSAKTARGRRDYRIVERWARRELIPDSLLERASLEEWDNWRLMEASGLDAESCRKRVSEWRANRKGLIAFT